MLTCGATLVRVSWVVATTSGCRLSLAVSRSVHTPSSVQVTVVDRAAALPKEHVAPGSTPEAGVTLHCVVRLGPSGSVTSPAIDTGVPSWPAYGPLGLTTGGSLMITWTQSVTEPVPPLSWPCAVMQISCRPEVRLPVVNE